METEVKLTKLASCAGCGAKVGAGTLVKLLDGFRTHSDPRLLVGYDKSDDASVYYLDENTALVQTTDFFPPIVDDPFLYGQIAAANAISDVYAMGGEPKLALNILCLPESMTREMVQELLRGGTYMDSYVVGYEYINLRYGWVLSNYGTFPLGQMKNQEEIRTFIDNQASQTATLYWVNRTGAAPRQTSSLWLNVSGQCLVARITSAKNGLVGMLLIHLDMEYLSELAGEWKSLGYDVVLLDANGETVTTTDTELAHALADAGDLSDGHLRIPGTISNYLVQGQAINFNGITCYAAYDEQQNLGSSVAAFWVSVLILLATVVVLLVCRWNSAFLYRPIRELLDQAYDVFGRREQNQDEFDYIYYTYGLSLYGNMPLVEPLEYKEVRRIKEFVIAIDTSGSVSGDLVQRFVTKTYNILRQQENFFTKINLHIIQCDAEVQEDRKITSQKDFDNYLDTMQLHGFGGTAFRPVFQYVDELVRAGEFTNLKGMIYFTDGRGIFPEKKPDYDAAFVFLDDGYDAPDVPVWAIKLVLQSEEI